MDETWTKLARNIVEIQNHNAANLSFEENHRYAYNMVLYKNGDRLYKGASQLVAENLDKLAKEYIIPAFPTGVTNDPVQRSQEGEMLLKALKKVWDDHTSSLSKLRDVLKYMVSEPPAATRHTRTNSAAGSRIHEDRTCTGDMGSRPHSVHQAHHTASNRGPCHIRHPYSHPNRTRRVHDQPFIREGLCRCVPPAHGLKQS